MLKRALTVLTAIACFAASQAAWAEGSDRAWGAIAVHSENGAVAYGSGYGATRTAASSAAIADCLAGMTAGHSCNVVQTFNKGCVYVSAGCNEATNRCGYFLAATQGEAASKCMRQGFAACQGEGGCAGQ
jgi:hypothetical protein